MSFRGGGRPRGLLHAPSLSSLPPFSFYSSLRVRGEAVRPRGVVAEHQLPAVHLPAPHRRGVLRDVSEGRWGRAVGVAHAVETPRAAGRHGPVRSGRARGVTEGSLGNKCTAAGLGRVWAAPWQASGGS